MADPKSFFVAETGGKLKKHPIWLNEQQTRRCILLSQIIDKVVLAELMKEPADGLEKTLKRIEELRQTVLRFELNKFFKKMEDSWCTGEIRLITVSENHVSGRYNFGLAMVSSILISKLYSNFFLAAGNFRLYLLHCWIFCSFWLYPRVLNPRVKVLFFCLPELFRCNLVSGRSFKIL